MCDLFPSVEYCCCCSLRVGMLFISVWAIITGSIALSVIEKHSNWANLDHMIKVFENNDELCKDNWVSCMGAKITMGLICITVMFMLMGTVLLIGTMTAEEGIVQIFVLGMFVAILASFAFCVLVGCACLADDDACPLQEVDWLTAAALLLFSVIYLVLWLYFIAVANSFVVNGDT